MRQNDGVTFPMIIQQIKTIQSNNCLIHYGKDYLMNAIHFYNKLRMDTHTTIGYLSKVKMIISFKIVKETVDDDVIHYLCLSLVFSIQCY